MRCVNAAITEHERSLTIDSEHGSCHQAMLAVGSLDVLFGMYLTQGHEARPPAAQP